MTNCTIFIKTQPSRLYICDGCKLSNTTDVISENAVNWINLEQTVFMTSHKSYSSSLSLPMMVELLRVSFKCQLQFHQDQDETNKHYMFVCACNMYLLSACMKLVNLIVEEFRGTFVRLCFFVICTFIVTVVGHSNSALLTVTGQYNVPCELSHFYYINQPVRMQHQYTPFDKTIW